MNSQAGSTSLVCLQLPWLQLHFHTFFPLCKAPHSSPLRPLPVGAPPNTSGRNGRRNTELCRHACQLLACRPPSALQLLFSSGHGCHSVTSSCPLMSPFLRLGPTLSCAISISLLLSHSQEHTNLESICHSLKSPPAESQEPLRTPEHVCPLTAVLSSRVLLLLPRPHNCVPPRDCPRE